MGPGRENELNGDSFLGSRNKERTKVQPPTEAGHRASNTRHLAHVTIAMLCLDRNPIFLTPKCLLQPAAPQTRSPRGHKAVNTKNGVFGPPAHQCQFSPSLSACVSLCSHTARTELAFSTPFCPDFHTNDTSSAWGALSEWKVERKCSPSDPGLAAVNLSSKHIHKPISSGSGLTGGDQNNFSKWGLERAGETLRAITIKSPANFPDPQSH